MAEFRFSSHIHADPATVFELFADFSHAAENISAIKELTVLTDGPIGAGTRFRETRTMMGRDATEEMEITAFEPGRGYTVGCETCGCYWESEFIFTPDSGGTRVDLVMRSEARTLMAKLMSPVGLLFAGTIRKCIRQDLEELKALAEGGAPAGAEPA